MHGGVAQVIGGVGQSVSQRDQIHMRSRGGEGQLSGSHVELRGLCHRGSALCTRTTVCLGIIRRKATGWFVGSAGVTCGFKTEHGQLSFPRLKKLSILSKRHRPFDPRL
jgi:hypothetical protein